MSYERKFDLTSDTIYDMLKEAVLASKLCHPNIVSGQLSQLPGSKLYKITYPRGTPLSRCQYSKYTLDQIKGFFAQAFSALKYLHCSGLTHARISPENIIVNDKAQLIGLQHMEGCQGAPCTSDIRDMAMALRLVLYSNFAERKKGLAVGLKSGNTDEGLDSIDDSLPEIGIHTKSGFIPLATPAYGGFSEKVEAEIESAIKTGVWEIERFYCLLTDAPLEVGDNPFVAGFAKTSDDIGRRMFDHYVFKLGPFGELARKHIDLHTKSVILKGLIHLYVTVKAYLL